MTRHCGVLNFCESAVLSKQLPTLSSVNSDLCITSGAIQPPLFHYHLWCSGGHFQSARRNKYRSKKQQQHYHQFEINMWEGVRGAHWSSLRIFPITVHPVQLAMCPAHQHLQPWTQCVEYGIGCTFRAGCHLFCKLLSIYWSVVIIRCKPYSCCANVAAFLLLFETAARQE